VDDPDELEAAIARLRAAIAADAPATIDLPDVARVLAGLAHARAESAARWEAIGRLAPAAKAQRARARDATRLLDELRAAVAAGADLAPLLARLGAPRDR
jgi:hypothetical protein